MGEAGHGRHVGVRGGPQAEIRGCRLPALHPVRSINTTISVFRTATRRSAGAQQEDACRPRAPCNSCRPVLRTSDTEGRKKRELLSSMFYGRDVLRTSMPPHSVSYYMMLPLRTLSSSTPYLALELGELDLARPQFRPHPPSSERCYVAHLLRTTGARNATLAIRLAGCV